jgi:Ser-tRNA(Ala) deacylase AlaX
MEMNFRDEYGDYAVQEAIDAIVVILRQNGVEIDEKSFTWTLVGVLFDKGIIPRQEFERIYSFLKSQMNGKQTFTERKM